jgi:GNAT superfamily N-acetyltransferase
VNRDELLELCFGRADFPPGALIFEMKNGDDVLSHVDLYWRRIVVGPTTITVAAIGQVCTDPDHRGLGYASALVRRAHAAAREHPIGYACLFSAYFGLYEKLGYRQPDPEGNPDFLICTLTGEPWPPGRIDTRGEW